MILLSELLTSILLNEAYAGAATYMPTLLCATALESVVSFFATVYMVKKKSMNSFFTAMSGALLNIVLNLVMIPRMGAIGAAIATLVSYGSVFLIRMIDTPRYIRFRLYLPRLIANIVLLLSSCVVMTVRMTGWIWIDLALTVAIVALNAPSLLGNLKSVFKKRSA